MSTHDQTRSLVEILEAMLTLHERMLVLAEAQREALAKADAQTFERLAGEHAHLAAHAADLDRQRQAVYGDEEGRGSPATLSQAIAGMPESSRPVVMDLAGRLKTILPRVRHEQAVLREAASAMLAHLDGLTRHVARALGHAGTYTHKGLVPQANLTRSAIDMKF